jgi:hypothetical protein
MPRVLLEQESLALRFSFYLVSCVNLYFTQTFLSPENYYLSLVYFFIAILFNAFSTFPYSNLGMYNCQSFCIRIFGYECGNGWTYHAAGHSYYLLSLKIVFCIYGNGIVGMNFIFVFMNKIFLLHFFLPYLLICRSSIIRLSYWTRSSCPIPASIGQLVSNLHQDQLTRIQLWVV